MASQEITIIYYTDNRLEEPLATKCREKLVESAQGKPIISVSQEPVELGTNICMSGIGSSWLSLYKQLYAGVEAAKTKYVATAEHDCMYHPDHFNFIPLKDNVFYYNENVCFVQWGGNHPELNGMYSTYWEERRALSQLICNRDLLLKALKLRLDLLDEHGDIVKQIMMAGEPGASKVRLKEAQEIAKSGKSTHLASTLGAYIEKEVSDVFFNKLPNLDVRHSSNFTGPKRGKNRTYSLPYWGEFKNIING